MVSWIKFGAGARNENDYSPEEVAAMIAAGTLVDNPAFNRGFDPMFDPTASEHDVMLTIAKYIPALSSPIGGKAVLGGDDFDLNTEDFRSGWGRGGGYSANKWLHSDMKDMAYFYVYLLYRDLIEKGRLKW